MFIDLTKHVGKTLWINREQIIVCNTRPVSKVDKAKKPIIGTQHWAVDIVMAQNIVFTIDKEWETEEEAKTFLEDLIIN